MNRYILLDLQDHHVFWAHHHHHQQVESISQSFLDEFVISEAQPGCLSIMVERKEISIMVKEYFVDPLKLIQSPNLSPELEKLNLEMASGTLAPIELQIIWGALEHYLENDPEMIFEHLKFPLHTGYGYRNYFPSK